MKDILDSMTESSDPTAGFSEVCRFSDVIWKSVPDTPGVYVIHDLNDIIYVGMAGRDGQGSLRKRLRDHASGQMVNMFAQYLFLARVQFLTADRITHPRDAKIACQRYIAERCSLKYRVLSNATEARALEMILKRVLRPALNAIEL